MEQIIRDIPAPLLVIIASFDPSGEGIDHFDPEHPEMLTDPTSPYYGEQWAMSDPAECYKYFFAEDESSLKAFYKEMTCGRFYFYPARVDDANARIPGCDGVVKVTINKPHPAALRHLDGYDNTKAAQEVIADIVKKAAEYIDFNKFDSKRDYRITPDECGIVILNAGYDRSSQKADPNYDGAEYENAPDPAHRFMVHGTSQHIDVPVRGGVTLTCYSNTGEFRNTETKHPVIGVSAHELAHNLGAQDMYSRYTPKEEGIRNWPTPRHFSLMCNGNHIKNGYYPSYIDPYQRIYLGWADADVATEDGVYTLYSTLTGKYNALIIPTPNPDEYFLCEVRIKEGFEKYLTDDDQFGGVVIWHIDEKINEKWFLKAQCVSCNIPEGGRHDLGNALLPREGFQRVLDEDGNFVKFGPLYADDGGDYIPYFYKSDDPKTSSFDSKLYCGAAKQSYSLNNFPEGVSTDWNLHIDVLDEAGSQMKVKITRTEK